MATVKTKGAIALGEKAVQLLSTLLAAALIVYGGYAIYDALYIQNRAYASSLDLQKYRPTIIDDDSGSLASELAKKNEDYRAWLTMYDTGIDYPVMQGKDDLYYASHDVFKKSSLTGSLYLAAANKSDFSDNYNLIYGHHINANALFGTLDRFTNESYAKNHSKGILVTRDSAFDVNVFAVIKTDAYDSAIYKPGMRDLSALVSNIQAKQLYFNADVATNASKVLAMSTCESAETNGRLVVFATLTLRETPAESAEPTAGTPATVTATPNPTNTDPGNPHNTTPNPTQPSPASNNGVPAATGNPTDPSNTTPAGPGAPDDNTPGTSNDPEAPGSEEITDDTTPLAPTATAAPTAMRATAAAPAADEAAPEQAEPAPEEIADDANPLANVFRPTGGSYDNSWALLNLLCALVSLFVLAPFGSLRDKYRRAAKMREANEQGSTYKRERFSRRLKIGVGIEVALAVGAMVAFLVTADFTAPMALIDKWTPLMLLFPTLSILTDARLARYRSKQNEDHDDDKGVAGEAGPQRQVAGA